MADTEIRLNADEIKILFDKTKEWGSKTTTERQQIRDQLIQDFLTERDEPIHKWSKSCMKTKISTWISNHITSKVAHRVPKLIKTVWSAHDVMIEKEGPKIQEGIDRLKADGFVHIAAVNKARSERWDALGLAKQQEYEDIAETWTLEGPEPMLREQVITKRVPGWVAGTCGLLWDQADIMTYVSYVWRDSEGNLRHARYDTSMLWKEEEPSMVRFTEQQPNWQKNFPESFKIYANLMLSADDEDRLQQVPPKAKGAPAEMELDSRGLPLLPSMDSVDGQSSRQATIRKLFSEHYVRASGQKDAVVPWKTIMLDNTKCFRADIIPDDVVIQDPSKMDKDVVKNLWNHIVNLQKLHNVDDQFHFTHFLQNKEWVVARYDVEVIERQKTSRKRTKAKTARGPPGIARLPAVEEEQADGELEDKEDMDTQAGDARAKGKQPVRNKRKSAGHTGTRRAGDGSSATQRGQAVKKAPQTKEKNCTLDDSSDTSVTPYEEESASSRGEIEHIDLAHLDGNDSTDEEEDHEPADSHLPDPRAVNHKVPFKATVTLVAPPERILYSVVEQPPAWVNQHPQHLFAFLWTLSRETAWHELLTCWKPMLDQPQTLTGPSPVAGEWAHWNYPEVAIPERIHSSPSAWANLIEWIEEHPPLPSSGAEDLQRWLLVTGMVMRDTRCVNDTEDNEDADVPFSGPIYMRWSVATLKLVITRVLPVIEDAHRPGQKEVGQQDIISSSHVPPGQASTSSTTSTHGQSRRPGILTPQLVNTGAYQKQGAGGSIGSSVRGRRGGPPGIRADDMPSTEPVPDLVGGQGFDLGSISQVVMAGGTRKKVQPYVLVPSSAVARNTRGRARALQGGQVPDNQVPDNQVPGNQVPIATDDVVMEDVVPGPSQSHPPPRKSNRKKNVGKNSK